MIRPDALTVDPDNIPDAPRARKQWVCWGWRPKPDKPGEWTKVPLMAATGTLASSTDPRTWASFADALARAEGDDLPGIGYMFSPNDPYTGVDLDKCRDPVTGELTAWATPILDELASYAELSPSGTGLHCIVRATKPGPKCTAAMPDGGKIEIYDTGRYFTMTGHRLPGAPTTIEHRQNELRDIYTRIFGTNGHHAPPPPAARSTFLTDDDVISRAGTASNAPKFRALWSGDTSEYAGDDSAADLALLSLLSFWTQDPAQLDRLFRRSGLYRDKWEQRADYREWTITKALDRGEVWKSGARAQGFGDPKNSGENPNQGTDRTDRSTSEGTFVSNGSDPTQQNEDIWPPRQPLPDESPAVPAMPDWMVPEALRPWVRGVATRTCLPLEMVAIPAIVGAGAVVGRTLGIRPGQYDDYTAVPNFWGAVVERPGRMKTSAIDAALKPLGGLVANALAAHVEATKVAAVEIEAIEAEIAAIRKQMTKAAAAGTPLDALKEQLIEKRKARQDATRVERRYLTHDATVEKLGELLRENPRGLLLKRDELSGWLRTLDKPGREGDREFFLEAWNGTGSFTTDRIGRGTIHIPALTLSVLGGIQPGKLRGLITDALDGGAGDDGLLQRLQLLVWPDRLPPWEKPDAWPEKSAREAADAVFTRLDAMVPTDLGATTDDDIPFVRFSPAAQVLFDQWRDALEHRLRTDELDDSPAFASHLSKYRSLLPSLALIFELIDIAASPRSMYGRVGEASFRLAEAWCEFLELHARKLYTVELAGGLGTAHTLVAKIEAGAIAHRDSVRDIYRAGWSGLKTPDRVLLGLQVLAAHGWVHLATESAGGRPTHVVLLHPELRTPKTEKAA